MPTETLSRFYTHSSRQLMQAIGYASQFVETPQGKMHYYHARGSGQLPPIVVLHGFGTHAAEMYRLLQRLRRYSSWIVAPDLPMHGFSEVPRGGIVLEALDEMFYAGMDQILKTLGQVIVFGNSLGGLAAIRYYLNQPDRVRVLVLSSPAGAGVSQADFDAVQRIFNEVSQQRPHEVVDRLYNRPPIYRWFVARELQMRFARQELKDFLSYFRTEHTFTREELQQIKAPTLMIWGQGDRILENHLDFFKAHMPAHVKFLEPAHFSHAPYLEHSLEMAHQISSFALLHCPEVRVTGPA
ncbi:MAG TPA: alpha/beta hydrolase [Candidatus Obscuribacterales bacterium]